MENVISCLNIAILIYFALLAGWYILILFAALPDIIKTYQESKYGHLDQIIKSSTIPITIIIPAYNEEKRILNCLYSILQSDYKNVHIIVVNDGSKDETLNVLIKEFKLFEIPPVIKIATPTAPIRHYYQSKQYSHLTVIDKVHGPANNGADCHNAGLNATATPIVITLDADTILEPDALTNMVYSFLAHKHCISVGGAIYILNGNEVSHGRLLTKKISKKYILAFQCIEYFRAFTYGRAGFNNLSGALCYPGAFTLFETKAVKEFGGFDTENYAYDSEITLKIHHNMRRLKYPTHVRFTSSSSAWTTVPSSWKAFWMQRNRWQRGMLLSAYKHKTMLFNPFYGLVGLVTFPAYVFFEILGPVVECSAYMLLGLSLLMGIASWQVVGGFILLAWGYILLLTIATFFLSLITSNTFYQFSNLLRVLWVVTVELFGFRQFRAACCFWATLQFFMNRLLGKTL
jgi:cellulose synthase/poly-beta-1,6-N-acetylglucosamine synthase-like glycosyltransferase